MGRPGRDVLKDALDKVISQYRYTNMQTILLPEISLVARQDATMFNLGHRRRFGFTSYDIVICGEEDEPQSFQVTSGSELQEVVDSTKPALQAILITIQCRPDPLTLPYIDEDIRRLRAIKLQQEW